MELSQKRGTRDETKDMSKTQEELGVPQSFTPFINSGEELLQWLNDNNFRSPSRPDSGLDFEETCREDNGRTSALFSRKKLQTGHFSSGRDKNYHNGVTFLEPLTEEVVEFGQEIRPNQSVFQRQVCWSSLEVKSDGMVESTQGANHLTQKSKSADGKSKHEKQSIIPKLSPTEHKLSKNPDRGKSIDIKEAQIKICKPVRAGDERNKSLSTGAVNKPLADRAQKTVNGSSRG